jgi:hypothetical protein
MGSGVSEPEPAYSFKLVGLPAKQDISLRMTLNKGSCNGSVNVSGIDSVAKLRNLMTILTVHL